jgi:hypothetical protein
MSVKVFKTKKDGELEQIIYDRVFKTNETKEVVLYGFDGKDNFYVSGSVKNSPRIRIVGGGGADFVSDESSVIGWGKKTLIYDNLKNTEVEGSKETRLKLSDNKDINRYERTDYKFDKLYPLIDFKYNNDDGVFLGGGFMWVTHGFRKEPYKQKQLLTGNIAARTGAFEVIYNAEYVDLFGKWDLGTDLEIVQPFGIYNFFGFGNESEYDVEGEDKASEFEDPIDFYRIRYQSNILRLKLIRDFNGINKISFGPTSTRINVNERDGYFISDPDNGLDPDRIFDSFYYLGFAADYEIDTRDHQVIPVRGVYGKIAIRNQNDIKNTSGNWINFNAQLSHYFEIRLPTSLVVANRIGYKFAVGDPEFFGLPTLGMEDIRGLRRNRFTGDQAFYYNLDLRLKLFSFRSYLFPGSVGLIGFYDVGRVWFEGEDSDIWHDGKGFGLYLAPLDFTAISLMAAFGEEEILPVIKLGFQF